jgi:type IV pilus assembly protein PilY1
MKTKASARSLRRLTIAVVAALSGLASAAVTDLAQTPIASSSSSIVKPNVNFILDHSGSMAWAHAPDEARPFSDAYGYKSSHCNSIYYNPAINYVPPKKSDGTDYPDSVFTDAWHNGYDTGDGKADLRDEFRAYTNTTSNGQGNDSEQAAYY